jgi:peroxiredoxin
LILEGRAVYGANVLKTGEIAPDFAVGERTLYQMLAERAAVIFFFPKAFTPG